MALERNGRRAEAVEAYRHAVAVNQGHEKSRSNLARLETGVPEIQDEIPVADEQEGVADVGGDGSDEETR